MRNPDGMLRSSQFVRARIVWKTADGLVVPVTAVSRVSGQYFVFVAEGADKDGEAACARQRAIKVGPIVGNDYPVLEGIKPGEQVVVSGAQKLRGGRADRARAGSGGSTGAVKLPNALSP